MNKSTVAHRLLLLVVVAASVLAFVQSGVAAQRPNIVFILVDDLGYGDLSCTGNQDVPTYNIDRLAAQGTRFTQFYVAYPICSPSRVAFTTGQYPPRLGIHSFLASRRRNRERGMHDYLSPDAPAIARTFQQAGYATAHFGKWHMGGGRDVGDAPLPQAYGFDKSLVSFEGLGDRVLLPSEKNSAKLGRGNIQRAEKHKLTEIYVDRAIQFIDQHRDDPFYVHLWLNDVHDAHRPGEEALARFAAHADRPYHQEFFAVLWETDRQIGRLIDAIDEAALGDETIIIFTSDNGPTAWPHYYKDGGDAPGSTGGFRGRKWSLYEGGIRMPLIVRYPRATPTGTVDDQSVMVAMDFFPTLCALAGIDAPDIAFDGTDVSEAWRGTPRTEGRRIYWEYGRDKTYLKPNPENDRSPNLAVRDGDWKLLMNFDGSRIELYNLVDDPQEQINVAAAHGELVEQLSTDVLNWRRRVVGGE